MKTQISITINKKILDFIDNKRGLVSRSKFIEFILENALKEKGDSHDSNV
jgi:metal-responsive CopG/Arc/MetJ family transcriptional regulator